MLRGSPAFAQVRGRTLPAPAESTATLGESERSVLAKYGQDDEEEAEEQQQRHGDDQEDDELD